MMKTTYEETAVLRCVDTSESEVVSVAEFMPRISMKIDVFPGTAHYRRLTLQWVNDDVGYSTEVYGRTFTSRGPRIRKVREVR